MQILSAARFTTAAGRTLDLRGYVVVATSNIGSEMLMESRTLDRETLVRRTVQAATQDMRPEIYARFDAVCVFNRLSDEVLEAIAKLHLERSLQIVRSQGHDITQGGMGGATAIDSGRSRARESHAQCCALIETEAGAETGGKDFDSRGVSE